MQLALLLSLVLLAVLLAGAIFYLKDRHTENTQQR
jgi:hypothetical protein